MTQICLIRHGETDWNYFGRIQGSTDIPLNDRGRDQARSVARYLGREDWDCIYSSPLSRAFDTATAIAGETGISDIVTDPRLRERDFGEAEGIEVAMRGEVYGIGPIPGAETREDVQVRALEVLQHIALREADRRIIAVSHGGFISAILALLSDGDIVPGDPPLKNTCMNLLNFDGSTWHIEWYNRVTPELEAISADK
jgi:uncharacterized phosphatase